MSKLFDNPYKEKQHSCGNGIHKVYKFDNNWGASVCRFKLSLPDTLSPKAKSLMGTYGSYTNNESQWELAVVEWYQRDGEWHTLLSNDNMVATDCVGYLSEKQVEKYLKMIKALPMKGAELVKPKQQKKKGKKNVSR